MVIRRYLPGEEGEVWQVYFRATHESNARDYHPELLERWAPVDQDMGLWAERLKEKNPLVALVDGRIVGMAEVDAAGEIDYFYVHPDFQSRGVGKALLAALEGEALRAGCRMVSADVSITAKGFFEANGFRVKEARENVILGHPAPNFAMSKELGYEEVDGVGTCPFCRIAAGRQVAEVVLQSASFICFAPLVREVPGHTVIASKMHFENMLEAPGALGAELIEICRELARYHRSTMGAAAFNLLMANGEEAQQSVPHLHFHYLPRRNDDGIDAWPLLPGVG